MPDKRRLIHALSLTGHVEGGYFRRTYQSDLTVATARPGVERPLLTSIHYMLTDDSPIGYLHRNRSDILHFFQLGSPLTYYLIHPDGRLEKIQLGPDPDQGHRLQLAVQGGCWKATVLEAGEFGLVSEAVAPGFDYRDMELARPEQIRALFPALWPQIAPYVRP